MDNMYHAGWAWAGNTPFHHTKLIASHFGGTRNPMAISWPARIKPDKTPRSQFHHVNDIAPTIYEILGITPPKVVDGFAQDPIDGVSMAYTFADAKAPGRKRHPVLRQQRQPRHLSRRLVRLHVRPADAVAHREPGARDLGLEQGRLGALRPRHGLLAGRRPGREGARAAGADEGAVPEGSRRRTRSSRSAPASGCASIPRIASRRPTRAGTSTRRRRACPSSRRRAWAARATTSTIDAELGENASGVLYALGGASGGLTLYMDKGELVYEYNMMIIERYIARSKEKLAPGKHRIEVDTTIAKPGAPAEVVLTVDGKEVARTTVKRTVPAAFTASETFDVGVDLGSPVSLDYFDRRPFRFDRDDRKGGGQAQMRSIRRTPPTA